MGIRGEEMLTVLVVCAANQCRSRVAETLLHHALVGHENLDIRSAGVDVRAPMPMCPTAQTFVQQRGLLDARYAAIPARQATAALLTDCDLVLVADAKVRAGITALAPNVRRNTFTMAGAGAAALYVTKQRLLERAIDAHAAGLRSVIETVDGEDVVLAGALDPGDAGAPARWLRAELEAAQGLVARDGGWDIADAHASAKDIHSRTLQDVASAMDAFATLLASLANATDTAKG